MNKIEHVKRIRKEFAILLKFLLNYVQKSERII